MKLGFSAPEISPNNKYALILLGSFATLLVVVIYCVLPLRTDIAGNDQMLVTEQQRLASYQSFAEQNKDYQAFQEKHLLNLVEAKKLIPDKVTVTELVTEYNTLAEECGVALKSVKPPAGNSQIKKVAGVYPYPIKMTIVGNYYKIINFLARLEHEKRFVNINGISIETQTARKGTGEVVIVGDFSVYSIQNSVVVPGNKKSVAEGDINATNKAVNAVSQSVQ